MNKERLLWIAVDPTSLQILELAKKVAAAPTTLLITGESGTGKDYLAREVHELSPRRDAPFLKIDCASLPPNLVESELFGHERGAFTGAVERKLGRFELGGRGTIVLDEVAALTLEAQGKLLRVLQERTFERLGGTESITQTDWTAFGETSVIVKYDNDANVVYSQWPASDLYNPNKFAKRVYTEVQNDSFYYCIVAFSA